MYNQWDFLFGFSAKILVSFVVVLPCWVTVPVMTCFPYDLRVAPDRKAYTKPLDVCM